MKILGDLAEASLTVTQMQSVPYGTLRISASTVFGVTVLNGWISEFIHQYPKVNVEVLLTNQYVDLVTRGIDVVFRSGPLADSSVVAHLVGTVPYWLCTSPTYLATSGEPLGNN